MSRNWWLALLFWASCSTGFCFFPPGASEPDCSSGKASPAEDYHNLIDTLANKVEAKVIKIRHDLHQNPELPNREVRTAKTIADHLTSLNLDEVRTEVGVHGIAVCHEGTINRLSIIEQPLNFSE